MVSVIELGPLAVDTARAAVAGFPGEELQAAIDQLAAADGIIAATPVYKAGISGLFKTFVDVLDNDLLVAKPVLLAATGGTPRHALVIDDQMRPLFAYMRALTLPTSVYAAPEDWGSTDARRPASIAPRPSSRSWCAPASSSRSPTAPGRATSTSSAATPRAPSSTADDVDFGSRLMRLATGGR